MNYKVAGEYFLVEKEYTNPPLGGKKEFTKVVKILAIGEKVQGLTSFKVGDRVLVGGTIPGPNEETYIAESQIFRWVLEDEKVK